MHDLDQHGVSSKMLCGVKKKSGCRITCTVCYQMCKIKPSKYSTSMITSVYHRSILKMKNGLEGFTPNSWEQVPFGSSGEE